jgi:hypothetical protein
MEVRTKLRHLLQVSSLYRVQLLLGKMNDADLNQEAAILYGKVNLTQWYSKLVFLNFILTLSVLVTKHLPVLYMTS